VAQKRHQEVELGRRQVDPLSNRTIEFPRRLIERPPREQEKSLDRLDGRSARNFELAAPDDVINRSQFRSNVFKNMDLHRAPRL
jgi:hypothetical protein